LLLQDDQLFLDPLNVGDIKKPPGSHSLRSARPSWRIPRLKRISAQVDEKQYWKKSDDVSHGLSFWLV